MREKESHEKIWEAINDLKPSFLLSFFHIFFSKIFNKFLLFFRNTTTNSERNESTAEHSWSVSMIIIILIDDLKKEFGHIDELKTIKLGLIHDVVEIYAGDVMAFDVEARKNKEQVELEALKKLMLI